MSNGGTIGVGESTSPRRCGSGYDQLFVERRIDMLYTLATLNETELEAVQALEKKIGKRVLAMRPLRIGFDELSDEEMAQIQELEDEFGLTIVAVK
jgi:hypothetical protein